MFVEMNRWYIKGCLKNYLGKAAAESSKHFGFGVCSGAGGLLRDFLAGAQQAWSLSSSSACSAAQGSFRKGQLKAWKMS
jgi:hypothetical protein